MYYKYKKDAQLNNAQSDHGTWRMLDESFGCAPGVYSAISFYKSEAYRPWEVHDDMESFIVLSGSGWAKVGDEEFRIEKDTCLVAPAGVRHCVKCDDRNDPLVMFWFHAPQEK